MLEAVNAVAIALLISSLPPTNEEKIRICQSTLDCRLLAEAGYFEARGEGRHGVLAVMQTILNRKNSTDWKENSVRGVIYAPYQFSYTSRKDKRMLDKQQRERSLILAYDILQKDANIPKQWEQITHYHAKSVSPHWGRKMTKMFEIGNHIFYKGDKR